MDIDKTVHKREKTVTVDLIPATPLRPRKSIQKIEKEEKILPRNTISKPATNMKQVKETPISKVTEKKNKVSPVSTPPPKISSRDLLSKFKSDIVTSNTLVQEERTQPKINKSDYVPNQTSKILQPDKKALSSRGFVKTDEEHPVEYHENEQTDNKPISDIGQKNISKDIQNRNNQSSFNPDIYRPATEETNSKINNLHKGITESLNTTPGSKSFSFSDRSAKESNEIVEGVRAPVSTGSPTSYPTPYNQTPVAKKNTEKRKRQIAYQPPVPKLPDWVAEEGISPSVRIKVIVVSSGYVKDVIFLERSGHPDLDSIAEKNVRKFKYEKSEKPEEEIIFKYHFRPE